MMNNTLTADQIAHSRAGGIAATALNRRPRMAAHRQQVWN